MKPAALVSILGFVALFILHQDFWNWSNTRLVFGFLPVGLAYHASFSLVAGGFWWLVSQFAWPSRIEAWADEPDPDQSEIENLQSKIR